MKIYNKIALSMILFFAIAASALAQVIRGNVTDKGSHEPIIGATIEAVGTGLRTVTDIDGNFCLTGLKNGEKYTVTIKYLSFENVCIVNSR